ncbi:MAG: biotin--[acetyl-CoA-carboxylase] ligase [FCB group bacterium]|nr:biotin--[acetyl-CoA-carboxylase] ligase [FCB group bacterium]
MIYEPKVIGKNIYHVREIVSTNVEMLSHPEKYPHGSVLTAVYQTAGRGRADRAWNSESGGLYMSLLLKEEGSLSDYLPFVLLSALAVVKTLKRYTNAKIEIKWPNDVYANDRKICGILAESNVSGSILHLVIGIGVNVENSVKDLEHLRHPAIALKDLTTHTPAPEQLMNVLLAELDDLYAAFCRHAFPEYLPELDQLLYSRGKPLQLHTNGMIREITPLGFHSDASLICLEKGKKTHVFLGEF